MLEGTCTDNTTGFIKIDASSRFGSIIDSDEAPRI